MRLIDADALLEYLMINMGWHDEDGRDVDDWDEKRKIIKDLIDGVPTVDAVPVVRCKDCKYFIQTVFFGNKMNACRFHGSSTILPTARIVTDDWFCADGERREE